LVEKCTFLFYRTQRRLELLPPLTAPIPN